MWHGGTADPAATDHERTAWTRLMAAIGSSRRASWIADQCAPTDGNRSAAPLPADAELPDLPVFPEPPRRAGTWSRPAIARTLPDHFQAIAYHRVGSGGQVAYQEIGRAQGSVVDDTVQLGFDPTAPAPPITDAGPAVPDGMRWLVDPDAAEKAGLLIRVPLPAGTNRIDRLIILGILGSVDATASATRLSDLLIGHHHSHGLSILPIGTASNNTAAERSGMSQPDDPAVSFPIERRIPAPPDGSDGALLARAFGIPADTLRGVAHADDGEQADAALVLRGQTGRPGKNRRYWLRIPLGKYSGLWRANSHQFRFVRRSAPRRRHLSPVRHHRAAGQAAPHRSDRRTAITWQGRLTFASFGCGIVPGLQTV